MKKEQEQEQEIANILKAEKYIIIYQTTATIGIVRHNIEVLEEIGLIHYLDASAKLNLHNHLIKDEILETQETETL